MSHLTDKHLKSVLRESRDERRDLGFGHVDNKVNVMSGSRFALDAGGMRSGQHRFNAQRTKSLDHEA